MSRNTTITISNQPTPWIQIGPEPALATCRHCGEQLTNSQLIREVAPNIIRLATFHQRHRNCPPPDYAKRFHTLEPTNK